MGPDVKSQPLFIWGLPVRFWGLSTLSFYGRPQDKLTNIPIGFGIGVVIGTVYMTYQAATNPDEFYRDTRYEYKPQFHEAPIQEMQAADLVIRKERPTVAYQWEF